MNTWNFQKLVLRTRRILQRNRSRKSGSNQKGGKHRGTLWFPINKWIKGEEGKTIQYKFQGKSNQNRYVGLENIEEGHEEVRENEETSEYPT